MYGNTTSSNTLSVHRTPSRGGDLFALTVFGDRMIDAAICYGGVGTVRRPDSADQGDLAAGLLEDKAKVKVLRRQDEQVWLMPRTPSCSRIPGDEAQILGKVLGVLRLLCGVSRTDFYPQEDRDSSIRGGS
ncbi:LexA family protein [Streptomyces mirabilis]|uniref:LexA family protein n=1 Tax=Streptomyces mirabilis TaxID=68239 RepID=UPI00325077CA